MTETEFWKRVKKTDGCWLWTGGTCLGYGKCLKPGTDPKLRIQVKAHRVSWELANGPIPAGLCVLHRCDNPPCVSPEHLFLGTLADNRADCVAKGRQAKGDRNGSRTHPERRRRSDNHPWRLHPEKVRRGYKLAHSERMSRGESHYRAKLTAIDVLGVRMFLGMGVPQRAIARAFEVSKHAVHCIGSGKTWRPLTT